MFPFKTLTLPALIEWATAALVFASGLIVGHQARDGYSPAQWAGAAAAILGSITLAVIVRAPAKARRQVSGT